MKPLPWSVMVSKCPGNLRSPWRMSFSCVSSSSEKKGGSPLSSSYTTHASAHMSTCGPYFETGFTFSL